MKYNINKAIRIYTVYILNIYQLIVLYNTSIDEMTENFNLPQRNIEVMPQRDLLNMIAEHMGIDMNNLIDIDIIEIRHGELPLEPQINEVNNNQNDPQNVHDSSIQTHLKKCIDKLKLDKANVKINLTDNELINEIKNYIFNEYKGPDDKKEKSLNTLNKMKKINGNLSKVNINEIEVLKLVWNRINNPINTDKMTIIKENLVDALNDCIIDDNNIHCLQGRMGRIIQCLECADAENIVNLKPLWAIKEELAKYFGKYRNKLYNSLSEKQKKIYNKLADYSDKEKKTIDQINQLMFSKINNKLKSKYVSSGILSLEQYDKMTVPYFAEFK